MHSSSDKDHSFISLFVFEIGDSCQIYIVSLIKRKVTPKATCDVSKFKKGFIFARGTGAE